MRLLFGSWEAYWGEVTFEVGCESHSFVCGLLSDGVDARRLM